MNNTYIPFKVQDFINENKYVTAFASQFSDLQLLYENILDNF